MSTNDTGSPADTWRGRHTADERPQAEHQWQAEGVGQSTKSWWRKPGVRVGLWGLLLALLIAGFVHRLMLARPRIPLVAVFATEYDWPLPPNAWAHEDLEQLSTLENIRLLDSSPAWRSRDSGLKEFSQQLTNLKRRSKGGPVIVYVSMHSAVAKDIVGMSRPYLLPPGCNVLDKSTWLPLHDVLTTIAERVPNHEVLLMLDCQQHQFNPHFGQLGNEFIALVPAALNDLKTSKISVITAANSGEQSWTSPTLRGSIFATAVRDGLGGNADRAPDGDRNGFVSRRELHSYVKKRVSRWSNANRAAKQEPQLLTAPEVSSDADIVWTIQTDLPNVTPPEPLAAVAIDSLWQKNDELKTGAHSAPYARFPFGWQRLQHNLIMLEELASAGYGYSKRTADLAERIEQQQEELLAGLASANSPEDTWQSLAHASTPIGGGLQARSLPMCALLGSMSTPNQATIKSALERFTRTPSSQNLQDELAKIDRAAADGVGVDALVEVHRLRLLRKYAPNDAWIASPEIVRTLALTGTAESTATPRDYRCWPWIEAKVDQADRLRRPVQDGLFAPSSLGDPAKLALLQQAETAYAEAEDEQQQVILALETRDQIWDELVYLCEWFLRYGAHEEPTSERELPTRLSGLVRDARRLDEAIAGHESLTAFFDDSGQLALARQWADLKQFFVEDVQQLVDLETPAPNQIRDIRCLLRLPILPAPHRSRLRVILAKATDEIEQAQRLNEDALAYPQWLNQYWSSHPISQMVGIDTTNGGTKAADLVAAGDELRSQLLQLTREAEVADDRDNGLETLTRLAQRCRIAAAFGATPSRDDPVARLWRAQLRQFFVWHAQRSREDLLGPLRPTQPPFFAEAMASYQANAALLAPFPSREAKRMEQSAQRTIQAIGQALRIKAKSRLLLEDDPTFDVDFEVTPGGNSIVESHADAPAGFAAMVIRDREERTVSRGPLSPMDEATTALLPVDASVIAEQGDQLLAVAVFRGHEYETMFEVDGLHGARIEFQPAVYDRTQVVVRAPKQKGKSIVFILDCSASMSETLSGESQQNQASRLELAKSRLQGVLDQAARQGATRVGLRLFGHRVGWTNKAPLETRIQERYLTAMLKDVGPAEREVLENTIRNLPPSQDVEAMLRPGLFGNDELQRVRMRMQSLAPWGQSPLYLAVSRAIDDLDAEPPEYEKSIVVITDGLNYQWTPQAQRSTAPANTTLPAVIEDNKEQQIPLFIVGFGVPEEEQEKAEEAYNKLANSSGGAFVSVDRADDLLATLQGVLQQQTYGLRGEDGQWASVAASQPPGPAKIGTPMSILPSPQQPRSYNVELPPDLSQQIELEGGEAIELKLSSDARTLQPVPFDNQVMGSGATIDAISNPSGHIVRVHQPTTSGNRLEIEISLQHQQKLVTRRPGDVWIKITPLAQNSQPTGSPYLLYDPNFTPNRPVPVLKASLDGWPRDAGHASIQCWYRPRPAEPALSEPLEAILKSLDDYAQFRPLPGFDGVQYQVHVEPTELPGRPMRVRVVQQYTGDADAVRPTLNCQGASLKKVIRRFDAKHKMDSHSFLLGVSNRNDLQSCDLHFTAQDAVKAQAIHLPSELVVPIFKTGDTLPLGNPSELLLNPAQGN